MKLSQSQKYTLVYALVLLSALFGVKWVVDQIAPEQPKTAPYEEITPNLRVWMDSLAKNENCSPTGTWDTGSYSYGKYCYKVSSWREDASSTKFYENAETIELDNFRGDPYEQDRVLAWVVENKSPSHLVMRWKTSILYKNVGTPPQ